MAPGQVQVDVHPKEHATRWPTRLQPSWCECWRDIDVEMEVFLVASWCQGSHRHSVGCLIHNRRSGQCGGVSKFHDADWALYGDAVMHEHGEQQGAEHAALGGSCAESVWGRWSCPSAQSAVWPSGGPGSSYTVARYAVLNARSLSFVMS